LSTARGWGCKNEAESKNKKQMAEKMIAGRQGVSIACLYTINERLSVKDFDDSTSLLESADASVVGQEK